MDIRYSCNQRDFKRYTTQETRDEFLITGLYQPDQVVSVYSHVDRMVTLGCMPVKKVVSIDKGLGMFACGMSENEAATALVVMLDAIKVVAYTKSFGGVSPMPEFLIDFIVNWEVESYRSKVSLGK